MRILLLLFVLFTFSSLRLKAQYEPEMGIKFGWNSVVLTTESSLSDFTFNNFDPKKSGGYLIGFYGRVDIGNSLYLQPEVYYSWRDEGYRNEMLENDIEVRVSNFYNRSISVPLLAGYKVLYFRYFSVRAYTGPAASVQLKTKNILDNFPQSKDELKKITWGWQLGCGVDVSAFRFEIRYEWPLSNYSITDPLEGVTFEHQNQMLTLSFGAKVF